MTATKRPEDWKPVQRFPINEIGNDFVVGDIHGAYDLMWAALKAAKFDQARDRLFVCGDMVDRGAESIRALKFLSLPWVHAIAGNHEDMLCAIYDMSEVPGRPPSDDIVRAIGNAMRLGNRWWFTADPIQRDQLVAKFRDLPIAIEIETRRGTVGLVHADVPDGLSWPRFLAKLEARDEKVMEKALGSRKRFRGNDTSGVEGVGRVFFGHTPTFTGPKQLGNTYHIDQGAIFGFESKGEELGYLTLASLTCATASLAQAAEAIGAMNLIDVKMDDSRSSEPFGEYARQR